MAEDVVAICLVLLEGDASRPAWELVRAIETYQQQLQGHFGTTASDLETAFVFLGWEQGLIDPRESDPFSERVLSMPFSTWIPIILKDYIDFYGNDEGQSFDKQPGLEPSWRRRRLLACFAGNPAPGEVRKMLAEIGWSRELLVYFLEGRAQPWEEDSPVEEEGNILRLR